MSDPIHVDVAIIGAGTAGLTARRAAEKQGKRALMFDGGTLGTTCARVGCMPSKLLISAADVAHHIDHAPIFGIHPEGRTIDGREVMARVRRERDRFVEFVLEATERIDDKGNLVREYVRFTADTAFEAGGQRYTADAVVVATGSTPFVPPPFRHVPHLTTDDVFELEDLPESLLVVGTGVIGLELGQAFHRLGVRTTFVSINTNLAGLSDPRVYEVAERVLTAELDIHLRYVLEGIDALEDGRVRVRFDGRDEIFDRILIAAGRRANLPEGLDVALSEVDPLTGQVGDRPVFLAGDVTNTRTLLHEAADEGRIAGENAARYPDVRVHDRTVPLGIVFTDPQIAKVGLAFSELDPGRVSTGQVDYFDQGRSRVMNQHKGWVRIYADREHGRLLGAEMFGPRVEHTAHLLAWAIQADMTVEQALEMPFYHPVVEEGIRTALRDLAAHLRRAPPLGDPCEECGVGT